ncbi:MAG TPA: flagellar hook-basal body complex protein FliE [Actinomycetes bacterium]|nr:flagellar hook-basal body complex protein FliE [Actinomycetes bacterium]
MTIGPIGAIGMPLPSLPVAPTGTTSPLAGARAAGAASTTSGAEFASALAQGLEGLQATQSHADGLAVQAATGDLTDVHDYMIAATEASLATDLTVAVRNKAVEAFTEIMRMPV